MPLNALDDWELAHLQQKYRQELEKARLALKYIDDEIRRRQQRAMDEALRPFK